MKTSAIVIPQGAVRVDCSFILDRQGRPVVDLQRRAFEPEVLGSAAWPSAEPYPEKGYYPVTREDRCPAWARAFVEAEALRRLGGGLHSARMQYISGQMAWDE